MRRILGIVFFGVLVRDLVRAGLLIVLGVALATGWPDIPTLFLVFLSVASASVFANIENDLADVELDKKVKAYRPLPSGKYTIAEARRASLAFLVGSVAFTIAASAASGNPGLAAILLAIPVATHLYSQPPARFKSLSWIGVLTLSLIYLFPLLAGYTLGGDGARNIPIVMLLFLGFFLATGVKDFEDLEVDGSFGIRTPPVQYGVRRTATVLKFAATIAGAYAALMVAFYLLGSELGQAVFCLAIIPSIILYIRRLNGYASSMAKTELSRLVKGCLWTMYAWPTVVGIILFAGSGLWR